MKDMIIKIAPKEKITGEEFYKYLINMANKLVYVRRLYKSNPARFSQEARLSLIRAIRDYNNLALDFRLWLKREKNKEIPVPLVCSLPESCEYRIIGELPPIFYKTIKEIEEEQKKKKGSTITKSTEEPQGYIITEEFGLAPVLLTLIPAFVTLIKVFAVSLVVYFVATYLIDRLTVTSSVVQEAYNRINKEIEEILDKCEAGELSPEECAVQLDLVKKAKETFGVKLEKGGLLENLLGEETCKVINWAVLIPIIGGSALGLGAGIYYLVKLFKQKRK